MTSPSAPLHECRVLLTDDDPFVRAVYVDALRTRGCEVTEARGGDEAVTLARALQPDLVLMDLAMPGTDGWQALAALRADPETRALVVVALTATESREVRERAAAAGFDGFVAKPFTPASLLRQLEAVWERIRGTAPAPREGRMEAARVPVPLPVA